MDAKLIGVKLNSKQDGFPISFYAATWFPFQFLLLFKFLFKGAHKEKAPSNKTPTLTKSMIMDIWVVGTSNELFVRGPYIKTEFSLKKF